MKIFYIPQNCAGLFKLKNFTWYRIENVKGYTYSSTVHNEAKLKPLRNKKIVY